MEVTSTDSLTNDRLFMFTYISLGHEVKYIVYAFQQIAI